MEHVSTSGRLEAKPKATIGGACVGNGVSGRHGELGHHTGAGVVRVKEGFGRDARIEHGVQTRGGRLAPR